MVCVVVSSLLVVVNLVISFYSGLFGMCVFFYELVYFGDGDGW